MNESLGVTKQQEEAMKAGSLFGWDVPRANLGTYDENGILRDEFLEDDYQQHMIDMEGIEDDES